MLKRRKYFYYGSMALPLAFVGLPIYVYLQKIYFDHYGLTLAVIAMAIFAARLIDAIQDPVIGWASDWLCARGIERKRLIFYSIPPLIVCFFFLFVPPFEPKASLVLFSILTYTFYSIAQVNYYALITEMTKKQKEFTGLTGSKEAFGLIGMLIATVLPLALLEKFGVSYGYFIITAAVGIFFIISIILLSKVKTERDNLKDKKLEITTIVKILESEKLRKFLTIVLFSAIAASLPSTMFLFFTEYVLEAKDQAAYFLLTYFLFAVFSIPYWVKFSNQYGKKYTWIMTGVYSAIAFLFAFFLGAGNALEFYIICAVTGFCLGADLSIPPALYAELIDNNSESGSYFSLWNFVNKASLAIAAIIGLTVPYFMGLNGTSGGHISKEALFGIGLVYCVIPCVFKIIAVKLLSKLKV